eukprot:749260-Pelagomonas_calceolata.AAC.2
MSQLFHLYSCKSLYAAAVPPPTIAQALCMSQCLIPLYILVPSSQAVYSPATVTVYNELVCAAIEINRYLLKNS